MKTKNKKEAIAGIAKAPKKRQRITRERFIELSLANPKNRITVEERIQRLVNNAKQFTSEKQWKKEYPHAHKTALENGWLDKCTEHMSKKINRTIEDVIAELEMIHNGEVSNKTKS